MGDLRPFPGARARICGLQSRPELNGQEGVLRDEQNDRWLVLLDTMGSTDTPLAVKPTNLEILSTGKKYDAALLKSEMEETLVYWQGVNCSREALVRDSTRVASLVPASCGGTVEQF
eukprot:GEMP01089576.1.p1 GENE.GEMP01089576.1~~GEMP01089576.1.p1  ORF type:complete len:117 (+),score=28.25 GEMP01089576.1:26-376(+)